MLNFDEEYKQYSIVYVINDRMDIKNISYDGAAFAFIFELFDKGVTEILIQDNIKKTVYKWKRNA